MAVLKDSVNDVSARVDAGNALRTSPSPALIGSSGGRYRLTLKTGLLTLASAHTATAGHIGAFRWGSTTKVALIEYVRIDACMVTDFTTLQRFDLAARIARSYTASHSGGAAATITGNNGKLRTDYPTTGLTDFRLATTGDLTAGTHTIDTQPFLVATSGNPSDGATVGNIPFGAEFDARRGGNPIVLEQDEGLVFSNEVLMGAAGTAAVAVTVEWRELLIADLPSI